jgi:hypothetical protein
MHKIRTRDRAVSSNSFAMVAALGLAGCSLAGPGRSDALGAPQTSADAGGDDAKGSVGPTGEAGSASDSGAPGPVSDAGTPGDGPLGDAAGSDLIAVIVAQGLMGRTTISCDDGQSWIADRSFDSEGSVMVCGSSQAVVCGQTSCNIKNQDGTCHVQTPCSCIDAPGFAKGVAIGQSTIVATFGWGSPGVIMNSQDGSHWDNAHFMYSVVPGVSYGSGTFLAFSGSPLVSSDGLQWQNGAFAGFDGPGQPWITARAVGFLDYQGGGRFLGAGDHDLLRVSKDAGNTWIVPSSIPSGCANGIGTSNTILTGNNIAVIVTISGDACRSADGGITWTLTHVTSANTSPVGAFVHGKFMFWTAAGPGQSGVRYSSPDGLTWTATPMNSGVWLGYVGVSPTGTLVSTNGLWNGYANQVFYRSMDDGITWNALPQANYRASHPIERFGAGMIKANSVCPAGGH